MPGVRVKHVLVYSTVDPASVNIARVVKALLGLSKEEVVKGYKLLMRDSDVALLEIGDELVHADYIERIVEAELAVFLSRHEASARLPSLTVHVPGNWTNEAKLGGLPGKLCIAPAVPMLAALKVLERERGDYGLSNWLCSYEATHHGPYLEKTPAFFIEIGSTREEWTNTRAAELVAQAVVEALKARGSEAFIGIGGPHYAPKLTLYALKNNAAIGHIAPRYVLDEISPENLAYAIVRTREQIVGVVVDWKGTRKTQRERLLPWLEKKGIRVFRA